MPNNGFSKGLYVEGGEPLLKSRVLICNLFFFCLSLSLSVSPISFTFIFAFLETYIRTHAAHLSEFQMTYRIAELRMRFDGRRPDQPTAVKPTLT